MSSTDLSAPAAGAVSWTHLTLERRSAAYRRVTFEHPPINTITATTVSELSDLVDVIERAPELNVVVFDSAKPEFFLAHYATEHDPCRTAAMPPGPTGMHPSLDLMARLARAPAVSIASIRGRARGAGGEFVLACDLRFASRENTLRASSRSAPGSCPAAVRRPGCRGSSGAAARSRSCSSPTMSTALAPSCTATSTARSRTRRSTTRAIADRLARFDHEAIARPTSHVDGPTLPSGEELASALPDFFAAFGRPGPPARQSKLTELGLNADGDLERNLGRRVTEAAPDTTS